MLVAGSVLAERLASQKGDRVLVIDKRPHIAGNAFDRLDDAGMHQYGPHIFHTDSEAIYAYRSMFTEWRPYEHRVLAVVDGLKVQSRSTAPRSTPSTAWLSRPKWKPEPFLPAELRR